MLLKIILDAFAGEKLIDLNNMWKVEKLSLKQGMYLVVSSQECLNFIPSWSMRRKKQMVLSTCNEQVVVRLIILSTNDIPRDADKTGITIASHKTLGTSASDNDENKLRKASGG